MAQTGKSFATITPAMGRAGFPQCDGVGKGLLQASSQTYLKGAPVYINASGVIAEGASYPQTIYGFARVAADNTATDGSKAANVYKAREGELFSATLSDTWCTSFLGVKAMLTSSASSWYIKISTAHSASYNVIIRGLVPNQNWAAGDVRPEVLFTVLDTKIQGDSIANVAS